MEHVKTGIKEFNDLVPGFPAPGAVLVQGLPGAGKTVFALAAMDNRDKAKKIVVLTNNTPDEVKSEMETFKIKLDASFIDCYSWLSGKKAAVDSLANLSKVTFLIEDAMDEGSMVLLDSLTPLVLYNHEDEIARFIQQLSAIAKANSSIIIFTIDTGTYHQDAETTLRSLCDTVINLDIEKGLRIVKMRDTQVPQKDFYYELGEKGFRLRAK